MSMVGPANGVFRLQDSRLVVAHELASGYFATAPALTPAYGHPRGMNTVSTQAQARAQLLRHFTRTQSALPPELSLALRHPDLPRAVLHHGVVLPEELNDPENGWATFDICYWLLGTTPDTCDRSFGLVTGVWRGWGWPTTEIPTPRARWAQAHTPDGYTLAVQQSLNGYLSMAGSTPLFRRDTAEGDPLPTAIPMSTR